MGHEYAPESERRPQRRNTNYSPYWDFDDDDNDDNFPLTKREREQIEANRNKKTERILRRLIQEDVEDAQKNGQSYLFTIREHRALRDWDIFAKILLQDYGIGRQEGEEKVPYSKAGINQVGKVENSRITVFKPEKQTQERKQGAVAKHLEGRRQLIEHYYAYKKSDEGYDRYKYARYQEQNLARYSVEKANNLQLLTQSMQENGFSSIAQVEAYIRNYEKAFEKRTLAIAEEALKNYSSLLTKEREKLNDDTYISTLYNQLNQSGAKQHYQQASEHRQAASGISRDLGGYAPGDATLKNDLNSRAAGHEAQGRAAVQNLNSPLVKEQQFNTKKLSQVNSKQELKEFLAEYINNKQESVAQTREDLRKNPERIYELDALVALSKQKQGITSQHLLEQIIQEKTAALGDEKILNGLTIAVFTIALGVLTFGTGAVALALAAGNFALGAVLTYKEIEEYQKQLAAYNVHLSKDKPSAVWVIISVVGTVLDAAAVAKMSKQLVKVPAGYPLFNVKITSLSATGFSYID